jgi:geranylgeranyl pyrophosphate synthase
MGAHPTAATIRIDTGYPATASCESLMDSTDVIAGSDMTTATTVITAVDTTENSGDAAGQLLLTVEYGLFHAIVTDDSKINSDAANAIAYHLRSGGQRIRARLAIHAGLALQLDRGDIVTLAVCAELLHNASLIHDDLQDQDVLRHGLPSVWSAFGANTAICAGDLMLAAAYGRLACIHDVRLLPQLLTLTLARTGTAIHGQCMDLAGPAHQKPTIAHYEQVAMAKSGALLSLPTELVMIAAGFEQFLAVARSAAESFAVGYQIIDDMDDLDIDSGAHETKASFNILLLLQKTEMTTNVRVEAIRLAQHHFSIARKAAIQLPDGCGTLLLQLIQRLSARL